MDNLIAANAKRWKRAKITRDFKSAAQKLIRNKERYQAVSERTGVPWFIIAVIHEREASGSWNANIAQGDRWDRISTHVPKGRGPFKSWEDAAYDALVNCPPHAGRWKDWSAGGALTLLEEYNGLGYAHRGLPSPYIWSGTDQYEHGKYVADGVFDPNAVDHQLGCAGLILTMGQFDSSVGFGGEEPASIPPKTEKPKPVTGTKPAAATVGAATAATAAHQAGWPPWMVAAVALGAAVAIFLAFYFLRKK